MTTELPRLSLERVTVGSGLVRCTACDEPVPIAVEMWIGPDEDGDMAVFADPNTLDLEVHALTHGET